MSANLKGRQETTRDRLIRLLQDRPRSVDELAEALGITLNAVRSQLTILERDGIARITGERRGPRRPSHVYGLTPEGERLLSRAYVPALKAILEALTSRGSEEETEDILREAGRRLAEKFGRASGDFRTRVDKAVALLESLGATMETEEVADKLMIKGQGCPLSEAVEVEPRTCKCLETLIAELTQAQVEERCERGKQRRCVFLISPEAR